MSSFQSSPIIIDFTNQVGIIENSLENCFVDVDASKFDSDCLPSHTHIVPTGRTLRRKKDVILSVKRYSAPPTSPLLDLAKLDDLVPSTPPLTTDSGSSGFAPSETLSSVDMGRFPAHHSRTQSQPTPYVKVGHPTRPYYSVIRPRPTSLISLSPSMPTMTIPVDETSRPPSAVVVSPSPSRFQRNSTFLDVQIENGEVILPTPSALSPPVSLVDGPTHLPFAALGQLVTSDERRVTSESDTSTVSQNVSRPLMKRVRKGLKRMFSFSHRRP
ncbi:hypothetical protein DL96DRAFT_1583118 [Flagelloscypha sp. PMI_526]|nr:hypothetical protein DL96DRAFT_1583118 [Flagelloscypha sp. PMI_526]